MPQLVAERQRRQKVRLVVGQRHREQLVVVGAETAVEDPLRRRAFGRRVFSLVAHDVTVADGDARVDCAMVSAVEKRHFYE